VPGRLETLRGVSQITFDPNELLQSPEFKIRRLLGNEPAIPTPGIINPFSPY